MKTNLLFFMVFCIMGGTARAQSPEEKRAQKMMDSIMENMPEDQKAFMQQVMAMGEKANENRTKERAEARKAQEVKNRAAEKKSEDEFYWRNTIASNTQGKFSNWPYGKADIKVRFSNGWNKPADYLKVGEVSANGQVTLKLPNIDSSKWPRTPIEKADNEGDGMWANLESLAFSNEEVTYFSTRFSLHILRGEEELGNLKIGNAIKPVVNLNSPCCIGKAGDGYTAHWMYMSQGHSIQGAAYDNGINGSEGEIVHDLKFQPGWNLVKVRVEGTKGMTANATSRTDYWKNKYYTATTSLPTDAKYYFISFVNK